MDNFGVTLRHMIDKLSVFVDIYKVSYRKNIFHVIHVIKEKLVVLKKRDVILLKTINLIRLKWFWACYCRLALLEQCQLEDRSIEILKILR